MVKRAQAYRPPKKKKVNNRNFLKRLPECEGELEDVLFECYMMARRGKRKTVDEYKFETFLEENLRQLCDDIIHRRWKPSRSKAFVTHTPVDREIFAAQFNDRIVHHLLYAIVAPWWDKRFIYDSYSCRVNKGTDFGVERMQSFMKKVSRNGKKKAHVLKGDISGYFMSLNRQTLYDKVMWGLKRQFPDRGFLYKLCEYLWREVIFDDPCMGARIVGRKKDWEVLPYNKSLFHQPEGQGIVIGNLTSQLLSNIMLNDFDWYVKKKLGFFYYGRYVDDFFIIVPEEDFERAKHAFRFEIPESLKGEGLTMHPNKIYIQEVVKGCPFLGKMVRPFVLMPGRRYLKNMRKAFFGYVKGEASYETVQSYIGMGHHMSAYKAMNKVLWDIDNS